MGIQKRAGRSVDVIANQGSQPDAPVQSLSYLHRHHRLGYDQRAGLREAVTAQEPGGEGFRI